MGPSPRGSRPPLQRVRGAGAQGAVAPVGPPALDALPWRLRQHPAQPCRRLLPRATPSAAAQGVSGRGHSPWRSLRRPWHGRHCPCVPSSPPPPACGNRTGPRRWAQWVPRAPSRVRAPWPCRTPARGAPHTPAAWAGPRRACPSPQQQRGGPGQAAPARGGRARAPEAHHQPVQVGAAAAAHQQAHHLHGGAAALVQRARRAVQGGLRHR